MMGSAVSKIVAILALGLAPSIRSATIPFQGLAAGPTGLPLPDGTYSVRFSLYSDSNGTVREWSEIQTVAPRKGLFQVDLGSVVPVPESLFRGDALFLGISIGTDPEAAPRLRIGSVPWAIGSKWADTARAARFADSARFATAASRSGYADSARRVTGLDDSLSLHRQAMSAQTSRLDSHQVALDSLGRNLSQGVAKADTARAAKFADSARFATTTSRSGYADTARTSDSSGFARFADSSLYLVGFQDSLSKLRAQVDSQSTRGDSLRSRIDSLASIVATGVPRADSSKHSIVSDTSKTSILADTAKYAAMSDSTRHVAGLQDTITRLRAKIQDQDSSIRRLQTILESIGGVLNREVLGASKQLFDVRDGHTYPTVKIGNQVWMAKNLNYAVDSSWCYDYDESICDTYGRLYTWEAAMGLPPECGTTFCATPAAGDYRGVCPVGWHMPSDAEWDTLIAFAGGKAEAGRRLKTPGFWYDSTGTDEFGFAALPAGFRYSPTIFWNLRRNAGFWSSSELDADLASCYHMNTSDDIFEQVIFVKFFAINIRCVQD